MTTRFLITRDVAERELAYTRKLIVTIGETRNCGGNHQGEKIMRAMGL